MSAHTAAVLAALLVVLAGPTGGSTVFESHASDPYGLTLGESVHTPSATVTLAGTPVEVRSTATQSGYDPLTATVKSPGTERLRVELFDSTGERRVVVEPASDGTVSVPTDTLSSGTYYLALRSEGDGAIRAVERVVVSRHDVSIVADEARTTPDAFALYVTVIPGGDIPYRDIEVVATDGTHETVTTTTEIRLGLYAATVDRTALPPGEYAVYARLVGRPDPVVGMSEALSFTVAGERTETGQAAETETATAVATEETVTPTDTTSTQFPETGIVLLLAVLLGGGLALRLRR